VGSYDQSKIPVTSQQHLTNLKASCFWRPQHFFWCGWRVYYIYTLPGFKAAVTRPAERKGSTTCTQTLLLYINIMVFVICTMGMWILQHNGRYICRPKKTSPLCLVRGLKSQKRPYENNYVTGNGGLGMLVDEFFLEQYV
jgi:hypothetical protein